MPNAETRLKKHFEMLRVCFEHLTLYDSHVEVSLISIWKLKLIRES